MKKVVLKNITLSDWKSRNISVDFNNGKTIIKGRNGIGKSSIINAWCWLLTGYTDAIHPKNYELFDNRVELSQYTPKAQVTAIIEIDGVSYKLSRSAKALFTRKRGSVDWEKASSDKYELFIDDIEYSNTQFNEWIDYNICPSGLLPYLIDGSFFSTLCNENKSKAREVLLSVSGSISKDEFKGDYGLLENYDGDIKIDDVIASSKKKRSDCEKALRDIPIEISVYRKLLDNIVADESCYEKIKQLENKLKEIEDKIQDEKINVNTDAIKGYSEESARLIVEYEHNNSRHQNKIKALDEEIIIAELSNKEIKKLNDNAERDFYLSKEKLQKLLKLEEGIQKDIDDARSELKEIKGLVFNESTCAYCKQELPQDMVDEQKEKFNAQKEVKLKACIGRGKALVSMLENTQESIKEVNSIIEKGVNVTPFKDVQELINKKNEIIEKYPSYQYTDEAKAIRNRIDELNIKIQEAKYTSNVDKLMEDRARIKSELDSLYAMKIKLEEKNSFIDGINKKQQEQKETAIALAKAESILAKANEWIEERADIITHRVNACLQNSSIRMWTILKNGEIAPDCILVDKQGVKYGTTNTAERIKINIDVQRMFMNRFDVSFPIFIDECSIFSSYNIPSVEHQGIFIFASDDNKIVIE